MAERTNKSSRHPGYRSRVGNAEREILMAALRETGGNRTQAAKLLGISRSGLYHKMRKYMQES